MQSKILKAKLKAIKPQMNEMHAVRLHRAISWLKCAEQQKDSIDMQFVSLWIAFNACYAINTGEETHPSEKESFSEFIKNLVLHDTEQRFFNILWHQFSFSVRQLIESKFLFKPFWDAQGNEQIDWKHRFEKSVESAMKFVSHNEVPELLIVVLDRLYMLRNQLIHGGATFESSANRQQLQYSCKMLLLIIPLIIDIMIENKDEKWGSIYYPLV
jgi:Apea-like HEPN